MMMEISIKVFDESEQIILSMEDYEWYCKMVIPKSMYDIEKWELINDAIRNNQPLNVCFGHDSVKVTEQSICFKIGYTNLKLPLLKCQHVGEIHFAILAIIGYIDIKK